jgi:hypothetical protein
LTTITSALICGRGGLFSKPATADPNQVILEPDMLHALAVDLATIIWNSIPLPSNHFKQQPMPMPKRNVPCHCGSGKKYKQCCERLPAIPTLSADEEKGTEAFFREKCLRPLFFVTAPGCDSFPDARLGYGLDWDVCVINITNHYDLL